MRQIGLAVLEFCDSHTGEFPEWWHAKHKEEDLEGVHSWIYTVADHLENVDEIRLCPDDYLLFERRYMKSSSYVINAYLAVDNEPGAVRNLNQLRATSRTIVAFEGADRREWVGSDTDDPHEYNAEKDDYVWAHPKFDHAHATQWFSQMNREWGWVEDAVKKDIQLDRHFDASHYLYADGHVDVIQAAQVEEWIDDNFDFARPE
jgi:prepilin-type processing-associated H-X9-DG protein